MIGPDDLVQKMVPTEEFVEQEAGTGIRMPVQVQVEGPMRGKQAVHQCQARIKEIQVSIQILPMIAIAFRQLPFQRVAEILTTPDAGRVIVCW